MSFLDFDGFVFFAISLLVLIVIQRLLQKEIQIVLLLITGSPNLAIGIFSILLLPGVFIHELSHLMMSILLRVPVLKLSLVPEVTKKGRIRLGFVQTAKTDVVPVFPEQKKESAAILRSGTCTRSARSKRNFHPEHRDS